MPRAQPAKIAPSAPDERWTVVQVASFLVISYQTARNNMLAGDYGPSEYDAGARKLTVLASNVRPKKPKRKHRRKKHAKKSN
jgi:hypothetical protein